MPLLLNNLSARTVKGTGDSSWHTQLWTWISLRTAGLFSPVLVDFASPPKGRIREIKTSVSTWCKSFCHTDFVEWGWSWLPENWAHMIPCEGSVIVFLMRVSNWCLEKGLLVSVCWTEYFMTALIKINETWLFKMTFFLVAKYSSLETSLI